MDEIASAFRQGGPFMWPILVYGVFAAAIALERLVKLGVASRLDARAFVAEVEATVRAGNLDRALALCQGRPDAAVARVVLAGLVRADLPERELEAGVEEALLDVAPRLTRRTSYLGTLANVATLTGLLGTLQGLISAFDAVANAPPELKQVRLAAGIAVAMYTTFFGLVVAIPALIAQSVVLDRTHRILDDLERYGVRVVALLLERRRLAGTG